MLDAVTVGFMLGAGLLHASWHAVIKSSSNRIALLAGMGLVAGTASACMLPFVTFPSSTVWLIIFISVGLHVGYKIALARAYGVADLGQAFPLARGLVPLFATLIAFFLIGETPRGSLLAGIAVVSFGVLWLSFDAIRGGIDRRLFVAACAAGCTVAGYTALDAYGTRLAGDWVSFTLWLIVTDCGAFFLFVLAMQGTELWAHLARARVAIIVSGLLGLGSFLVFLWALSRAPVGVVAALRESSVLFATLIGMLVLREPTSASRFGAAGLILAGLLVIAVVR